MLALSSRSLGSRAVLTRAALLVVAGFVLPGCGGGGGKTIDRHPVNGQVTLDGAPLDQGAIRFEPFGEVKERTAAGSPITNGAYDIPKAGGLPPGKYTVSITSSEAAAALPSDPAEAMNAAGKMQAKPERIPPRYNQNTELVVEIKSGANKHDFPLTSSKAK